MKNTKVRARSPPIKGLSQDVMLFAKDPLFTHTIERK